MSPEAVILPVNSDFPLIIKSPLALILPEDVICPFEPLANILPYTWSFANGVDVFPIPIPTSLFHPVIILSPVSWSNTIICWPPATILIESVSLVSI